jgi:hypothetical protein
LIDFRGLLPKTLGDVADEYKLISNQLDRASLYLQELASHIHWLSGLREPIPRLEIASDAPISIDPSGCGVGQVLYQDRMATGELLSIVSSWYQSATGHRVDIQTGAFRDLNLFELTLSPVGATPMGISFSDAGEGMAQMLPVITLLAMAQLGRLGPEPIIGIEHPELHLHPAAHGPLANLFCKVVGSGGGPKVLVETHSGSLLREVQLQIVEGALDPQAVLMYWVRSSQVGPAELLRIEFDASGSPKGDGWPPGVLGGR